MDQFSTPASGSLLRACWHAWPNLAEAFFTRMAHAILRGIRVESKEELPQRIGLFLDKANRTPIVFNWKYKLDEINVA